MASKFRGSQGTGTFRPDLPESARMNALVEQLNVGPITEQALDKIHNEIRTIYPTVVDQSTQTISPTVGGGVDPDRSVEKTYNTPAFGYTGAGNMEARTAGNVGLSQERFTSELGSIVNNDSSYLSPDEEVYLLQEFARLKGVSTLEVEASPKLTEEFGRYLGQKTVTFDNNRYASYDREGFSDAARAPTMYRAPTQISNYNRQAFPDQAGQQNFPITELAKGNRDQIVQNLVDYGMLREHAEEKYDDAVKLNPEESVIAKNMNYVAAASTSQQAKQSFNIFENGMFEISNKVHNNLMNTMRLGTMSPQAIERFAMKIEQGNPNFTRAQARDFLYSFVASYGMVKEANPNAGKAYADFMILAVLQHAKTKLSNYERKKADSPNSRTQNETTEEAAKRNENALMVGISDDQKIGRMILQAMGFEQASSEENALAGSMAKNIVVDSFAEQEGNPDSESYGMWNDQLFQREEVIEENPDGSIKLDDDGKSRKNIVFTLTSKGLDIAERLTPMVEAVMPNVVLDVRYERRPVVPTPNDIEQGRRSRSGGPRKTQNATVKGTDKRVDHGDVTEMDMMKNVAENTGVAIDKHMAPIAIEIMMEYQNLLTKYSGDLANPQFIAEYRNTMMYAIENKKYQNMKGDGTGNTGVYGDRPGVVLKMDRQGNYIGTDSNGNETIVEQEFADTLDDFSDKIKDTQFESAILFIERNLVNGVSKEFFYDYFYGLNTRLNVDQTIGNYQHNKLIRALIESHKPHTYNLDNAYDVIALKAGIIKRFGYDKMDVLTAADQFDMEVERWSTMTTPEKVEVGNKWEGWASVSAIEQAIQFDKAIQNPNESSYTTGFYTEIDGLTNGMAHSASQSGDMKTAWGAGLFDPIRYDHWVRNYDLIEKFQREGNIEALADLENLQGNSIKFEVFLDAYNRVNESMKDTIRRLGNASKTGQSGVPMNIGLPGLITDNAHEGAMAIMELAHAGGDGKGQGSKKFMDAIRIMSKVDEIEQSDGTIKKVARNKLGRSFVKKPVMIFGYGAGAQRIRETVRMFVDDLFIKDPSLRAEFIANGIDIDVEFIDPLGVIAAEAVNQDFGIIKEFATTLSQTAAVAMEQGFALNIPTSAGYKINLGGKTFEAQEGKRVKYQYYPGKTALEVDDYLVRTDETGMKKTRRVNGDNKFQGYSQMMVADWNPFFEVNGFLKAATQITVMMNHANDNINMQRHLVNVHKRKLANRKNPIEFNSSVTEAGNTALHIFDGLLVQPFEAEMHAKELNDVFKKMASQEKGHTSYVIDSLVYQLKANGDKMVDKKVELGTRTGQNTIKIGAVEFDTRYKRLLNEEGMLLHANNPDWGTWHPLLDKYSFQWKGKSAQVLQDLNLFDNRRKEMAGYISNYHQFFWATQDNVRNILDANPSRVERHFKPKKKIQQ